MTGIVRFLIAIYLGGYFVYAGAVKIFDPPLFAKDIANFQLLPHQMVNLVAIILPWVEWVAGAMLMTGLWVRANATLIGLMLVVFIIAVISAIARGLNIECGCTGGDQPANWYKVGENTIMLAMAAWLMYKSKT
jgi:uncharacterized membrane protein YphA (DoxX/SURF4 family)